MRIEFKRRPIARLQPELVEVVTPRTNAATITATENLFAALATGAARTAEPFALELAATHQARWFLGRAMSPSMRRRLEEQLGAAYPQAELRRLDLEHFPGLDPACLRAGEQAAVCELTLSAPAYLPLRTFRDVEVTADSQADPLLGLLGAMSGLPDDWRALAQLACLRPASDDWGRSFVRFAVEHPLAAERAAGREGTSLTSVVLMGGALAAGAVAWQGYQWYDAGAWLPLGLLAGGVSAGLPGLVWLARRLGQHPLYDPRLVQDKLSRSAHICRLRLAIFAPQDTPTGEVEERLARLVGAYRQYSLASGNGLVRRRSGRQAADLRGPTKIISIMVWWINDKPGPLCLHETGTQ